MFAATVVVKRSRHHEPLTSSRSLPEMVKDIIRMKVDEYQIRQHVSTITSVYLHTPKSITCGVRTWQRSINMQMILFRLQSGMY